ncbi:MAG TPA: outer membrane lipoprotein-sorting protein [Spirochaetia bacterium]|nr:outer membrane lipoprotein-sorting protein [Spirochaetia bacterium]HBI36901.1 outer membrane lipoprotein-sorting protein [Spirochaetia bacterium]
MVKKIIMFISLLNCIGLFAQSAEEIINRVDNNEVYDSIRYEGEMLIRLSGKEYKKSFFSYGKGTQNSFMEFTNPDDEGTRYLKKDGKLFVYSPDTETVMPITGHMLKESIMGSDMSYEDTIDNDKLTVRYSVKIIEESELDSKNVWVVELNAKKRTESYPKQMMWIDKETYSVLKAELFALSGAKLKETRNLNFKKFGNRYFPTESEMRDLLRKDSKTVFKMIKIELDVDIPDSMFSLRNLER